MLERNIVPGFMTVHEAASFLGLSTDTIRRWAKKGLIKDRRSHQNHRLFSKKELERAQKKYLSKEPEGRYKILKSRKTKFTSIELFSGAGGLALGLENAGFETKLLVEIDKDCVNTLKVNKKKKRKKWEVFEGDIKDKSFKEYKGQIDLVAGGFPCQAFSYAGSSMGFEDIRGTLFFEFARCVKEVRPKIALAENVRGLLRHEGGRTLSRMVSVLEKLGYKVKYKYLRAQFMDVPQKRERLFIIGIRKDLEIEHLFPVEKDYTISLRDALHERPESDGYKYPPKKFKIMEMIPEGGYWRDLPVRYQKKYMLNSFHLGGGKTGMARRLSWSEPSLTLTCSPAQKQTERCHPEETRPLNIREYARIQTFPDDWEFTGSVSSQYKQIGNAVPVNLGYYVGRALVSMLSGKKDRNVKCMTIDDIENNQLPLV